MIFLCTELMEKENLTTESNIFFHDGFIMHVPFFLFIPWIILIVPSSTDVCFSQDSDSKIIRDQYTEIRNNLNKYQIRKHDVQGESAEGGLLTAYFDDTLIRLIVAEYFGETGKRVTEYYYTNQEIFFILDVIVTYNRPAYYDSLRAAENNDHEWHDPLKSKKTEERMYFKDNRMIRWIDKTRQSILPKSDQYRLKESEWIAESNKILSVFFNSDQ